MASLTGERINELYITDPAYRALISCMDKGETWIEPPQTYRKVFTEPATITRRNLIYHIWPRKSNRVWEWNIQQLLRRIDLFNGKRVVGISTGPDTCPARAQLMLRDKVKDFILLPNNAHLREMVTFPTMLAKVQSADPCEATFWGHAKGVCHGDTQWAHGTMRQWARMLYESCLDYWPLVQKLLTNYACAGSFKKLAKPVCHFDDSNAAWFYAGGMGWFRNRDLFSDGFPPLDYTTFGSESSVGTWFRAEQAAALFIDDLPHDWIFHSEADMQAKFLPAFEEWKKANEGFRNPGVT